MIGFLVEKAKALWEAMKSKVTGKNGEADKQNGDKKPAKDDGEIGKHIQFSDGHESHTLWGRDIGGTAGRDAGEHPALDVRAS